ncbi:MAG: SLOG family protein [Candidatus Paceibacterota bacterium]|jgi:uncharacterized phage-like protein YoqJ
MTSIVKPIIGVTGHRNIIHDKEAVQKLLKQKLSELQPASVITGMAIGFDTLVAETCLEMGIPFIAAVPCIGQERIWPAGAQEHYRELIDKAQKVVIVSAGGYAAWKMHARNSWIVNNSDSMICYFDGKDKGGTAGCVKYASQKKKPLFNCFSSLLLPPAYQ